jgi:hypothetical protein
MCSLSAAAPPPMGNHAMSAFAFVNTPDCPTHVCDALRSASPLARAQTRVAGSTGVTQAALDRMRASSSAPPSVSSPHAVSSSAPSVCGVVHARDASLGEDDGEVVSKRHRPDPDHSTLRRPPAVPPIGRQVHAQQREWAEVPIITVPREGPKRERQLNALVSYLGRVAKPPRSFAKPPPSVQQ